MTTSKTAEFIAVDGLEGVYMARAGKLTCFALRLRDGGLCLYSPISGMSGAARAQLGGLGEVTALLAPNHYHNKGLAEHAQAFPNASLVCSFAAEPRLRKVTGLDFAPLETLRAQLDDRCALLEPTGLKTGETWVRLNGPDGAWIVADAFSSALQKPGVYVNTVTLLKTFPKYGVKDAEEFKRWTLNLLESSVPSRLLPCHGSPIIAHNLGDQLTTLLRKSF